MSARNASIRRHTALRCEFAYAVAALTGRSIVEALRDFTDLHRRTTGSRPGESPAADAAWSGLIARIAGMDDKALLLDRLVEFLGASNLHRYDRSNSPYWPFRYDYNEADRTVRMHFGRLLFFRVDETPEPGLLSKARLPEMRDSLKRLFAEIGVRHPAARQVRGGSWLYNWESYRRLYPAAFTASHQVARGGFTGGSRWGQFHTAQGGVNTSLGAEFHARIAQLDPDDLDAVFPITTLSVRAPIEAFYREYGVD